MQQGQLVGSALQLSKDLTKDLDSVADRVFQLSQQLGQLQQRTKATYSEKACQADFGHTAQHAKLERAHRLAPFAFHDGPSRKIDWLRIRGLSLERMTTETDTRTLMELYDQLAYADLDSESGYNLTESNLIKVVQVCQLLLQYMQWNVEQGAHHIQLMQEERAALKTGPFMIPDMSLKGVGEGLVKLGRDYAQVADADLDAMFVQVRTEERTVAKETFTATIAAAKKQFEARAATLPATPSNPTPTTTNAPPSAAPDVGVSRDQGYQVWVGTGPNTPASATAAATAAALAAAQAAPYGYGAVPSGPPAAYGYGLPSALQQRGEPSAGAAGAYPALSRSQAYHNAFQGIPTSQPSAETVQAERALVAARLSQTKLDDESVSLTAMVRNKQGASFDSAAAVQASAGLVPQGMGPVQATGLAAAMAAFDAQRQSRDARGAQYSPGQSQALAADPFSFANGGGVTQTVSARGPTSATQWSEATGHALFRPGLATSMPQR